jgi:DNA-binding transcriptional MerR regulator
MNKAYLVREFAALTGTTVRALHYYDRLGLLRPSSRRPNGYRVYTPDDLLKLEQVVALKFLGLPLREIQRILANPALTLRKSLKIQAGIIAEENRRLERAARAVRRLDAEVGADKRVDFKKVIKIIKEIQMSEEKKRSWAEEFYTPEEMKEFEELGQRLTPGQMKAYQKKWADLLEEVKKNLDKDPAGPVGQDLARRWQALFEEAYGGHPKLARRIGEAYRQGAVPEEYRMISPEVWEFINRANAAR